MIVGGSYVMVCIVFMVLVIVVLSAIRVVIVQGWGPRAKTRQGKLKKWVQTFVSFVFT